MEKIKLIKQIVDQLNEANKSYYDFANPIMSDKEYDNLYNKLISLEKESGIVLNNSPTQNVGYITSTKWDKTTHEFPALSLDKTKDRNELISWIGNQEGILSWKCDGLTVVMTFDNHTLTSLATRGNGIEGELITANAPFINGIPKKISYDGHLVVRGEAMISYETFEEINNSISNEEDKYKTCRNLASGTIRNLDSKIVSERNVEVKVFELVYCDDMPKTVNKSFELLESLGFDIVDYKTVNKNNIKENIEWFENEIVNNPYASDGLVLTYNNIEYGKSLGMTSKFPRHSIAFKWNDGTYETMVTGIEWSVSKNSINPVLEFRTVNIDGADISRASIHNISIMKNLELGKNDVIEVYLANKIIPQIAENQTRSNTFNIPTKCPVCHSLTEIVTSDNGTQTLICTNPDCNGKLLSKLSHFVSKNCMNIEGLSEATLEKIMSVVDIKNFHDLYTLKEHKDKLVALDGLGAKSVEKFLVQIEGSKHVKMSNFLAALSIPLIGKTASKDISKYCCNDIQAFIGLMNENYDFTCIDGFGNEMQKSLTNWWNNYKTEFMTLVDYMVFDSYTKIEEVTENKLLDKIFVITGKLEHFTNRNELVAKIESLGGKVSGSVSAKTDFLINNDTESSSSKNKKAKQLNIPIISEQDFLELLQ